MIELRIPTKEEIDEITFDDWIFKRASDENCPPIEVCKKYFNYEMFDFIGIFLEEKIIGLASLQKNGKFHFEMLKDKKLYAREALKKCLEKINCAVFCEIPVCYKSVINFAKNNGFIEFGNSGLKYRKEGIDYNMIQLIYKK